MNRTNQWPQRHEALLQTSHNLFRLLLQLAAVFLHVASTSGLKGAVDQMKRAISLLTISALAFVLSAPVFAQAKQETSSAAPATQSETKKKPAKAKKAAKKHEKEKETKEAAPVAK